MKLKKNDRVLSTNDKTLIAALKSSGYKEVAEAKAAKGNNAETTKTGG